MKKKPFSLFSLIETRFVEPISVISILKKNVIIEIMIERIFSLSLTNKKTINKLSSTIISRKIFDN